MMVDMEPFGHAEHPGKFINDWSDRERGAFLLGQKSSLAETVRLKIVAEAARAVLNTVEVSDHDVRGMSTSAKVRYTRFVLLQEALAALNKET